MAVNVMRELYKLMGKSKKVFDEQVVLLLDEGTVRHSRESCEQHEDRFFKFYFNVTPNSGLYKNATCQFRVFVDVVAYPENAPKVHCLSNIFHPNFNHFQTNLGCEDSNICVSHLSGCGWDASMGLEGCIMAVLFLFYQPNIDDPLNQYREYSDFEEKVSRSLRGEQIDEEQFDDLLGDGIMKSSKKETDDKLPFVSTVSDATTTDQQVIELQPDTATTDLHRVNGFSFQRATTTEELMNAFQFHSDTNIRDQHVNVFQFQGHTTTTDQLMNASQCDATTTEQHINPSHFDVTTTDQLMNASQCDATTTGQHVNPSHCDITTTDQHVNPSHCDVTTTDQLMNASRYDATTTDQHVNASKSNATVTDKQMVTQSVQTSKTNIFHSYNLGTDVRDSLNTQEKQFPLWLLLLPVLFSCLWFMMMMTMGGMMMMTMLKHH